MTHSGIRARAAARPLMLAFVLLLTCVQALAAQEPQAQRPTEHRESKWGIGFQSSFPAWGVSALYDVDEKLTAQAVVGAFGALTTYSGRLLYRIENNDAYDMYGFGTVGMWGHLSESVVGLGGGAGIELNWQRIVGRSEDPFPPLFSSVDLGFTIANFQYYNFSTISLGVGLHYRF